jgi:hypothetical protein
MSLFGGGKADHPMADAREARRVLDAIPANDPYKALEELCHWMESVSTAPGFKPGDRAQLLQDLDDAAQPHLRKLQREYLSNRKLSTFQENRMWSAIHEYLRLSGFALAAVVDLYATRQKGSDALHDAMPLLTVRALRALYGRVKWQHIRYGPFDEAIWGITAKIYALAETRRYAGIAVSSVYPGIAGETTSEQEFVKAIMFAASSPDSLLPAEIELLDRLIAHFATSFTLSSEQQAEIAYGIDLAASQPPLRLARSALHGPTLRFVAAGNARQQLQQLIQTVSASNAVPLTLGLGSAYEPAVVLEVLQHLAVCWSPNPPARKTQRHKVQSKLTVAHGFDGVLAVLNSMALDESIVETWQVEDVSMGGFGAVIPQVKGDWLKIGCLVALQPEGGKNWVIGVVRRFSRESQQQGTVGIQTLAKSAQPVSLRPQGGQATEVELVILLEPSPAGAEAQCLMRPDTFVPCCFLPEKWSRATTTSCCVSGRWCARATSRCVCTSGEHALQPSADVVELLGTDRVRHPVLVPFHRIAELVQQIARLHRPRKRHDRVLRAVRHEDRHVAIDRARLGGELVRDREIAGERHDARDALRVPQSCLQHDGAALRETREHDARGRRAALLLARDQLFHQHLRSAHAALVLAPDRRVGDVVPGAHHHAGVDGHRLHRRVRKHEANGLFGKRELGDDGREVVAVRAQAVQPDDAALRVFSGFDLDRFEEVGHFSTQGAGFGRIADFGRNAFTTASFVSM